MQELTDLFDSRNLNGYDISHKNIKPTNNQLIQKQISTLERKITRLKAAYLNEIITLEEFKNDKQQLENEIENIKIELSPEPNEINISEFKQKAAEVKAIFTGNYPDCEKNTALKSIISHIVYVKSEKKLVFHYYI